jgi:hypothetical protein
MTNVKYIIAITYLILFSCATMANLESKSRAGLSYSLAFDPKVSRFQKDHIPIKLAQFHRGSLTVEVPMNRYLDLGFAFDFTYVKSSLGKDPGLDLTGGRDKIWNAFLGLSFLLKPQYAIKLGENDLVFYGALMGGFGSSTLFTFGSQPMSDYTHDLGINRIPTPFPFYLESTPSLGIDFFFSSLIGIGLGAGYRMMWVCHPFVPFKGSEDISRKTDLKYLWYDLSSAYAMATLKLTI